MQFLYFSKFLCFLPIVKVSGTKHKSTPSHAPYTNLWWSPCDITISLLYPLDYKFKGGMNCSTPLADWTMVAREGM